MKPREGFEIFTCVVIIIILWMQINGLKATVDDCNQRLIIDSQVIANAGGDIMDAQQAEEGSYQAMDNALRSLNPNLPQQLECGQN